MAQDPSTGSPEPTVPSAQEAFLAHLSLEEDGATATPDDESSPDDESTLDESARSEPADDEEGDVSDTDDELDDDSEEPEVQSFTVKVDGKDTEVTLDELLKGYSRQSDYTKKTQQLAEERKAAEQKQSEVTRTLDVYAERLKMVEDALKENAPAEPDWATLRKEHPDEYAVRWAEFQQHKQHLDAIQAERREIEERRSNERKEKFHAYVGEQQKALLEAFPEWKDPAVANAASAKLAEFAKGRGFSAEELAATYDARYIQVLNDAMLYQELKAKTTGSPPPASKRAPVLKPGNRTRQDGSKMSQAKRDRQRLAKTGRIADAAAVFRHTLD